MDITTRLVTRHRSQVLHTINRLPQRLQHSLAQHAGNRRLCQQHNLHQLRRRIFQTTQNRNRLKHHHRQSMGILNHQHHRRVVLIARNQRRPKPLNDLAGRMNTRKPNPNPATDALEKVSNILRPVRHRDHPHPIANRGSQHPRHHRLAHARTPRDQRHPTSMRHTILQRRERLPVVRGSKVKPRIRRVLKRTVRQSKK